MTTAQQQIDWWAGPAVKGGSRAGQATRQGYIVIAPVWIVEQQDEYGYSAREHAAVLNSLRDACRRFSIDTDRVFLSGHSIGGDAAWDIGLAHPGPLGRRDPDRRHGRPLLRPLLEERPLRALLRRGRRARRRPAGQGLAEPRPLPAPTASTPPWSSILGRGHEDFYDEILRIFDWMGRFHRNFFPRDFTCETMRDWDNFFWWVEVSGLPPPLACRSGRLAPGQRHAAGQGPRHGHLDERPERPGRRQRGHRLALAQDDRLQPAGDHPVNGRRMNNGDQKVKPDLRVLLEDVRTRGDRQHPFWAALQGSTGRVRSEE